MQPVSCTAVLNLGRFWWCADLKRQGERHVGSYVQASISLCQSNATLHISAQLSKMRLELHADFDCQAADAALLAQGPPALSTPVSGCDSEGGMLAVKPGGFSAMQTLAWLDLTILVMSAGRQIVTLATNTSFF